MTNLRHQEDDTKMPAPSSDNQQQQQRMKQANYDSALHVIELKTSDKITHLQQQQQQTTTPADQLIKPTLKRYIILLLFCLNAGNKSFQWIQVAASTKKATILYEVDNYVINITSVIFMVAFIFLSWPACYLIESFGLRKAVLAASFGTACGSIVKCYSCHSEGIWLLMLGQVLVSLSEQLIFSVPSRLASVWFPDHQVSSAVALSILGQNIGVAFGFVIPQWYLNEAETRDEIGNGFYQMFLVTSVFSIAAYVLDYILFDEEPKFAPGSARLRQREVELAIKSANKHLNENVGAVRGVFKNIATLFRQIRNLLANRNLVLLSISYGINVAFGYTISTLLNQMLEPIWPDNDLVVGNTGFLIIVSGSFGSPIWGRILDKWRIYKSINLLLTFGTILSLFLFAYTMICLKSIVGIYISAAFLGFFSTGFIVAGLELAVELTYPEPELVTSSIMNVMPQIFGTIFVFIGSYIVDNFGPLATTSFYLACLLVAFAFLICTKETLKRQEMIQQEKHRLANTKISQHHH